MAALRAWMAPVLVIGVVALTVLGFYLSIYRWRGVQGPVGWDSTQYVWRTNLARETSLGRPPARLPSLVRVKQGRPGFPAAGSAISSLTGASMLETAATLPPATAASIGLGALALCAVVLRSRPWVLGGVAVLVALSPNVVLMMQYAYFDNLLVSAVFLAALVGTVASLGSRRALAPAVLLLAVAALVHASFFLVAVAVLLLAALAMAPASWGAWRRGDADLLDTPSGRLGLAAGGGAAVAAGAVLGLSSGRPSPTLDRATFAAKLRNDLPMYRLPAALPLAAAGAWLAGARRTGDPARRALLALLLSWTAIALGGLAVHQLTTLAIPANRLLVFALGIPILAAIAVALGADRAARRRPVFGVALLAIALALLGLVSFRQWFGTSPHTDPAKLRDGAWAASYLDAERIPPGRPVVFVVDERSDDPALRTALMIDHLLATLPQERVRDAYAFLGSPDDYLARRPSILPGHERYNRTSARMLDRLRHTYSREPVAILLPSYNRTHWQRWTGAHPETLAGAGAVISGTVPGAPVARPDVRMPVGSPRLVLLAVAAFALLLLTGLGWTLLLFGGLASPLQSLAVAPALGIAALVVGALALDRVGVRVDGTAAALLAPVTSALGWLALLAGRRRPSPVRIGE